MIDLLIIAIPGAIIGARAYYVLFMYDSYRGNILDIINIRAGGLAVHGGIITAVVIAYVYTKFKKISFMQIADITAPSIAVGQAIGRWGNFINKEAYGIVTDLPWGIVIEGRKVHPAFLYESLWSFAIFIFLMWYRKNKRKYDGEVFVLYFVLYSAGRFMIESLRTDSLMYMGYRVAQIVSLGLIIIGTITFLMIKSKGKKSVSK